MNKLFKTKWVPTSVEINPLLKWHLDLPDSRRIFDSDEPIRIEGWAFSEDGAPVRLLLKLGDKKASYALNHERPDVAPRTFHEEAKDQSVTTCGFLYDCKMDGMPISVGFQVNKQNYWLGHIIFEKMDKVLVGRRGNLFLNNDTNRSIAQYQGIFRNSPDELLAWSRYIDELGRLSKEHSLRAVFVVSPGKEFVHSDDFPYARGTITPVDEVIEKFSSRQPIIYPVDEMIREKDVTYSMDDTHWTDYGALLAARAICASFGDEFPVDMPPFRLVMRVGDLGKKLARPVQTPYFKADFSATGSRLTFENRIPNHGYLCRYENPESPSPLRVLLLGGSSSLNLAPWLSLCYREVLYVYTAGSIDENLVEKFRPDLLILQTTTRFLVRAPIVGLDLDAVVRSKLDKMAPDQLTKLAAGVAAYPESSWQTWMMHLIAASRARLVS